MKKILFTVLIVFCLTLMFSCAKSESIASHETTVPNETTTVPANVTDPPVGGSHLGDELYSPYTFLVDHIVNTDGTFSEHYFDYMDEFHAMERKWNHDRPALIYYLAKKMNLTREDLETYYAAVGVENVPESVYLGVLADTLGESMQYLKTEYAFYNNGKLYTIYDIYDLYNKNQLDFDINDPVYDPVWKCVFDYLDTPHETITWGDPLKQFVLKNTKGVEGYTPVEETTYVPETNEFGRILRDAQIWAKEHVQRKELPPDEEILLQYHIPGSIFDIVICTSESEKYTIYTRDSYLPEEEKVYSKLDFEIPEFIEYDDYSIVTEYLNIYGDVHSGNGKIGDGSCNICVEFTKGEEKDYKMFTVNLSESKKDLWGLFEVRELTELESGNLNKAFYLASINHHGWFD